jgi:phage/plasmid primase-like uncharacterized protein
LPAPITAADLSEDANKRARLRRLWGDSVPLALAGLTYLEGRGIPAAVAAAARVRYSPTWGSVGTFVGPAVLFPMQGKDGKLVGAEGRFIAPPGEVAKTHSAGAKSRGVFVARPDSLEAAGVTLCEGPITALSIAACGYPALALCGHTRAPAWLLRRLALRPVFLGFDYGEQGADPLAQRLAAELTTLGAAPYRLTPPAGAGDWNDYLQRVGLEALRYELALAVVAARIPGL